MGDVVIRASTEEVSVRRAVLSNCSGVLEGMLEDGAAPSVISMDDFDSDQVKSFVRMGMLSSHETTEVTSMESIVDSLPRVMPLIHKYDAKGLMSIAKAAVNATNTCATSIGALLVVKYDVDDGVQWMSKSTKRSLMKHLCSTSLIQGARLEPAEKMAQLPLKASQELMLWAMTDALYKIPNMGTPALNELTRKKIIDCLQ